MSQTAAEPKTVEIVQPKIAKKPRQKKPQLPDGTWLTKYGTRRVRQEGPTLEEAIFAARGLTDDEKEQVEVAASLIGMPVEEVREALSRIRPARRVPAATFAFSGRSGAERAVVVERKPTRRPLTRAWGTAPRV